MDNDDGYILFFLSMNIQDSNNSTHIVEDMWLKQHQGLLLSFLLHTHHNITSLHTSQLVYFFPYFTFFPQVLPSRKRYLSSISFQETSISSIKLNPESLIAKTAIKSLPSSEGLHRYSPQS